MYIELQKVGVYLELTLSMKQKKYINSIIDLSKTKNRTILQYFNESEIDTSAPVLTEDQQIENITSILKFDFSYDDKRNNGITFTPIALIDYMYTDVLDYTVNKIIHSKIADLSLGNGAFFASLLIYLKQNNPELNLISFIENNLHGYDIKEENIEFAKLILSIICTFFGEDTVEIKFNFIKADTLVMYVNGDIDKDFDIVVGNPPYVKQQNISKEYRKFIEENFLTTSSNYNLYYPFIEVITNVLKDNGKALLLVPNYILKIKSASLLREYLLYYSYFEKVVDFKHFKLFNGIDTYSMVLELSKNSNYLLYKNYTADMVSTMSLSTINWEKKYLTSSNKETINLTTKSEDKMISMVQNQKYHLDISTGIATQKDKLYLIDEFAINNDKSQFYKFYNDKTYKIEDELVAKIIKGSGSSNKRNIQEKYIIYPYELIQGKAVLISNKVMQNKYPKAWRYFTDIKQDLLKRSGSGSLDSESWYAYGRSQSLNRIMPKIIFPTNTDVPKFNFFKEKALFYNGYAIFGLLEKNVSVKDMQCITIILNSKLIDNFMHLTSYYIGGGYISYQKKYLSKISIPELTVKERDMIIDLNNHKSVDLDKFIYDLYLKHSLW